MKDEIIKMNIVARAAPKEPYFVISAISKIILNRLLMMATVRLIFTLPMLAIKLPFGILNVPAMK